ncbi:DUF2827 domain-containing protein [Variovorax sp. PAMC28562]|uniref:DUF2827 domain-containing protein n=1 Tax=Variovorax sp. PAMC28562 TaxID=2762323 RepID=UPI00164CE7F1|nr:DUF2827 domain-containing protein [Variovorax sp. PAMC28562]QNK72229.1 DUF2827 domain-containing protein [Variovorax sp. PAMC28562]
MADNLSQLRVGITIGLHHAAETLWNNGIKQNAVFLAEALKHCPNVASVTLANTTAVPVTSALPWDLARWPTEAFDASQDQFDVLIELGGQIDPAQTDALKRRGGRLVSYCCSTEYMFAAEAVLFDKPMWNGNLFINQRYDDIWMVPQVDHISRSYFEVLRRQKARAIPFVWSPVFLEERSQHLPDLGVYRPGAGPRRLSVLEPNINIVKFCLYPALIAEAAYRERPSAIGLLQVTNAERMARENKDFIALMNQLDIVRDHKAVFLGRYETPMFLAEKTDIVVSHQLENPLNYLYLEACWQGYALVHNAHLCADLGYYYTGNDVEAGSARLLEAIDMHDLHADAYRDTQRTRIARYLPGNADITATYSKLLNEVVQRPSR